eukprot:Skav203783  [mRNA]  locus=scaffold206:381912:382838:+ [translate_table: standard]
MMFQNQSTFQRFAKGWVVQQRVNCRSVAQELTTLSPAMGGYTEPEAVQAVPAEVRVVPSYLGRVKSYNLARGFGFLECPEVKAQHGRDVFMRADAVEDLTLSKIASASGPSAAVNRGEIFVSFSLEVNQNGNPEAQNVRLVNEVPLEFRQQLPEVQPAPKVAPAPVEAASKESKSKDAEGAKESKDKKNSKKKGKHGQLEGVRVGDCRVHIGQDAEDNWKILSAAKGRHWFFHLTDFPSCYVILECNEPTHEEKVQCAQICRDNTKHKLSGQVKVDATQCNNVKFDRKRDVVGECDYKDEGKVEILVV